MKKVETIYSIAEYDDGYLQIIILNSEGERIGSTDEFPRHLLHDYLSVFFEQLLNYDAKLIFKKSS